MLRDAAPALPAWLDAELPFTRYCVSVGDGLRMHVMEQGGGRPVLLLHGNPTWGFLYRKVAAALQGSSLRLIMPDLIGLGLSDRPHNRAHHTLAHHSAWIGELIEKLNLRNIIFVGQDWGGPIGLLALAQHTERIHGMVLLNTVVGPPRPDFKATPFHRFARLPGLSDAAFRLLGFPQRWLSLAQGDKKSIDATARRAYTWALRDPRTNAAGLDLARMVPDDAIFHPSVEPLKACQAFLESFRGPMAMVWGDRDPVLGSVGRFVERILPDPDAMIVHTDAGHFLQEEVPDTIAEAIRSVARR